MCLFRIPSHVICSKRRKWLNIHICAERRRQRRQWLFEANFPSQSFILNWLKQQERGERESFLVSRFSSYRSACETINSNSSRYTCQGRYDVWRENGEFPYGERAKWMENAMKACGPGMSWREIFMRWSERSEIMENGFHMWACSNIKATLLLS